MGLPSPFDQGIDAACNGHGDFEGKAYFFKGTQYIRYDWDSSPKPGQKQQDKVDQAAKPIALWKVPAPFVAGVDAVLEGGPGFEEWLYFFKGNQYCRYHWKENRVEVTTDDSGAPYTLATGWNLPSPFRNRLDTVVNDKYNNKDGTSTPGTSSSPTSGRATVRRKPTPAAPR